MPPSDYIALSAILEFDECQIKQCVDIMIVDDLILEMEETLSFTLTRTTDLHPNITLDPTHGDIVIQDNDGMSVREKV